MAERDQTSAGGDQDPRIKPTRIPVLGGSNDEVDMDLTDIYGKDFVDFRAWLISVQLKSTNPKVHIKY